MWLREPAPLKWAETDKILAALKSTLDAASPEEAAFLVKEMSRNRIQSNDALSRILSLAKENPSVLPDAVAQLVASESIPAEGIPLLIRAAADAKALSATLSQAIIALSKVDGNEAFTASLGGFSALNQRLDTLRTAVKSAGEIADPVKAKSEQKYARTALTDAEKHLEEAAKAFLEAPKLENHHLALEKTAAEKPGTPEGFWANAAVLALASRTGGSPESRELSKKALDAAWNVPAQKAVLIAAAVKTKNRTLDDRILVAAIDLDPAVAKAAQSAIKDLKLQAKGEDKTPKIGTLAPDKAIAAVLAHKSGDVALGEAVFARATCVACHTVSQSEKQKGPYLGNIVETYQRPDLAMNILDPNKTIAQGFASNLVTMKDGTSLMGFVTDEQGEQVTLRDIASQEHTFKKADIAKRETLPMSLMPPGLMANFSVHEMASLLDYLASLVKK